MNLFMKPSLFVCVESISNLYRVLMLCNDYNGALDNLFIVTHPTKVSLFEKEAQEFLIKMKKQTDNVRVSSTGSTTVPVFLMIEDAVYRICACHHSVGIEIQENSIFFDIKSAYVMRVLRSSDALIWGFEKDGIPRDILQVTQKFVQIRSRTSLNLVATMSIVLNFLWT